MMKTKKLYGIGINDLIGITSTYINGKQVHWYRTWQSMILRCYSDKSKKRCPTYIGCSVCESWLLLSNFKGWYDQQVISDDSDLDKDIISNGNKIYSPDNCRFIPHVLNTLFIDCGSSRGLYPVGVYYNKHACKFHSYITKYGKHVHLGSYTNASEASNVYNKEKLIHCINVADELFLSGRIDQEVCDAVKKKAKSLYTSINIEDNGPSDQD